MKISFLALSAVAALALAGSAFAHDPEDGSDRAGGHGYHHGSLQKVTEQLALTDQQKAQVQPIINQANPQIESIRRDAMQKTKTVIDNAMAQIRPLLTPDQQKKLDDAQNERRPGREGRGGHRGHRGQGGNDDDDNG